MKPYLDLRETEIAIKLIKDHFERELAAALHLTRVSAPLMVPVDSGLNDDLSGVERAVAFDIRETGRNAVIVHSLAKWKRQALARYGFSTGEGLYTDMNAIRRDEDTDALHSLYVDQWDWEQIIEEQQRCMDTLYATVRAIYSTMRDTEALVTQAYPHIPAYLPADITFISAAELEGLYPDVPPDEREQAFAKLHGAICVTKIGGRLPSGQRHGSRAPDYDDWDLNCDIILDYPELGIAMEMSSMGIRVSPASLRAQLEEAGCLKRSKLPYHKALLAGALPFTIGGGIGQSRLCMYFLKKQHIGEVQASIWPEAMVRECGEKGITLL